MQTAIILTTLALNSQILCQFIGCCNIHGTIHYFVQQAGIDATLALLHLLAIMRWNMHSRSKHTYQFACPKPTTLQAFAAMSVRS